MANMQPRIILLERISDFVIANRAVEFLTVDTWHFLEIGTFDEVTSVWLDGAEIMNYVDPEPLPGGIFGFAAEDVEQGAIAYYDNISVCGLNAPLASLFTP